MTYRTSKYFTPKGPFTGGFIDNVAAYQLKDGNSPYLTNARIDGMSVSMRPGYTALLDYGSGGRPYGIGSYLRASSANDRLVTFHNGKVKSIVPSTGVSTDCTGVTFTGTTSRMNFVNVGDVCYCLNGVDNYTKLSGTTLSQPSTGVTNMAPSFGAYYNGDLWMSGWSTNPNYVYKTGADFDTYSGTGSDNFKVIEQCTGLCANIESLFVFTPNTVHVTTKNDLTLVSGYYKYAFRQLESREGAVNHNSIVAAGNQIFYVTPSNKIMVILKGASQLGFDTLDLSHRMYRGIENTMAALDPDQSDSFGYYDPQANLVKWYFKSNGSPYHDVCVIYSVQYDEFLIDTNKRFYAGVRYKTSVYTVSDVEPKVLIDEYGYDDDGQAIQFEYRTKIWSPWGPTMRGQLWEARLYGEINDAASLVWEAWADGQLIQTITIDRTNIPIRTGGMGTLPVGTYAVGTEGVNTYVNDGTYDFTRIMSKGNLQVKCRNFQFIFRSSSVAARVFLKNLDFKVSALPASTVANLT